MASLSGTTLQLLNVPLKWFGLSSLATWEVNNLKNRLSVPTFRFAGVTYNCFAHQHNCGWPGGICTERTVELALADRWLAVRDPAEVCEIGAVTPYYWPHRVKCVVDPADPHPLVSERKSFLEMDAQDLNILSISTFEHIGMGDYNLPQQSQLFALAFRKLLDEASTFLVTFPIGFNIDLDDRLFGGSFAPPDVSVGFLIREQPDASWKEEHDFSKARRSYGPKWANSVAILERRKRLAHPSYKSHE
jgi:hypothetical protein